MKIGYARVSTADQNLDLQIRALHKAGCDLIFKDEGVSAVAKSRPQFDAAIRALKKGDAFVIWKMDRAFRSLIHALNTLEYLEDKGIEFQTITEQIDTTTAMGRFIYQIRNVFAELERELISERTKAGLEAARERGVKLGRPRKLSDQQVLQARLDIESGSRTIACIARTLNVSRYTVLRAIET